MVGDERDVAGWDRYYGWGRINVYNALYAASPLYGGYGEGGFCVKNASGEKVAWFDNFGNLILDGYLEKHTDHIATDANDEFRIQDSDGNDLAIIDATDGWMYIKGLLYDKQETLDPQGDNNFIIKDSNDDVVAYIDDPNGDVYLKRRLLSLGELVDQGNPDSYTFNIDDCDDCEDCLWANGKTPEYVRIRFKGIQANPGVEPVPCIVEIICEWHAYCAWWGLLDEEYGFEAYWTISSNNSMVWLKRRYDRLFLSWPSEGCLTYFPENDGGEDATDGTATVVWGSGIDEDAYNNQPGLRN